MSQQKKHFASFFFVSRYPIMSMLCYAVCILCSISAISTIPAPAVIYSAVIQNAQDGPIQCHVFWSTPLDDTLKSEVLTVKKSESYSVKEQTFNMGGTWTARGIVEKISCGNLVVTAPFDGVTGPDINWQFRVESNKILSVGPSA